MTSYRYLFLWLSSYVLLWTTLTTLLDPTVPYDAIEALNWAMNREWGSPKNPWLVGAVMQPALWLPYIPLNIYWYLTHFIAVAIGMYGVWSLAKRLSSSEQLAWLALLSLNLSGIINFDIIPYNDNYLLVMLWPWLLLLFIRAAFEHPCWWLPFALIAGLATMAKYSTLALLGAIFLLTLVIPQVRRCYHHPFFYIGLLIWLLLVFPNFLWLQQHDFVAFKWVNSQISYGLNLNVISTTLTVFYPLLIMAGILYTAGGRLNWPKNLEAFSAITVTILPLLGILVWFFFHRGGRLTEWLQPFMILAPPLMVGCITQMPAISLRNTFLMLILFALLVCGGYTAVMICNIRGAGQKLVGVKLLSTMLEKTWQQRYGTTLHYVGGAKLVQWLTFYSSSHPKVITPWSNETHPNIYTPYLSISELQQHGVILLGPLGESCQNVDFSTELVPYKGLNIDIKKNMVFSYHPDAVPQPLCVAFIAPKQGIR